MITIFNRKEVLITFSMETQAKARTLLAQNVIDYAVSTSDHSVSMQCTGDEPFWLVCHIIPHGIPIGFSSGGLV